MSSQSAARTLQDRPRRLALKAALRAPHEGPHPVPRKVVWMSLGIHEATYSRWLDDAHPQLPDLLELMAIVDVLRSPGALAVACRWSGDGYDVAPACGAPSLESKDAHRLLAEAAEADAAFTAQLAEALRDGTVDRSEACHLLGAAEIRAAEAAEAVDTLKRVAKGLDIPPLRATS